MKKLIFLLILSALFTACASNQPATSMLRGMSFFSEGVREEIREIEKSVCGINATVNYRIEHYQYLLSDGNLVPDPESPYRYKLDHDSGKRGITMTRDVKTLSGGGLIIDHIQELSQYTIITSSHLVNPKDTTDIYFYDENGRQTDVLFARYIVESTRLMVTTKTNWRSEAQLVVDDQNSDLAIIQLQTTSLIGQEFPNEVGYDMNLDWGDWVFLFGFPKGVKQLTGGWVSPAPYKGNLAVDAVVRFGFSGGPVFSFSKQDAKLEFVGVIKSVPRKTLNYVGYTEAIPPGYTLERQDMQNLIAKQETLVEYGTAYFVDVATIREFMLENEAFLQNTGTVLHSKYTNR